MHKQPLVRDAVVDYVALKVKEPANGKGPNYRQVLDAFRQLSVKFELAAGCLTTGKATLAETETVLTNLVILLTQTLVDLHGATTKRKSLTPVDRLDLLKKVADYVWHMEAESYHEWCREEGRDPEKVAANQDHIFAVACLALEGLD